MHTDETPWEGSKGLQALAVEFMVPFNSALAGM
jgi:hypothetical protein